MGISVIVSAAEAYPDKLFEIVCELLLHKSIVSSGFIDSPPNPPLPFVVRKKRSSWKERLESNRLSFGKSGWKEVIYRIKPTPSSIKRSLLTCGSKRCIRRLTAATISIPGHPMINLPITGWIYGVIRKLLMFRKMSTGRYSVRFSWFYRRHEALSQKNAAAWWTYLLWKRYGFTVMERL